MRNIVLLFIALVSFAFMAAGQTDPIKETLSKYDRAWNAKDTKAIAGMLDENYVYFSSVGTLTDKKSTLEFLAKLTISSLSWIDPRSRFTRMTVELRLSAAVGRVRVPGRAARSTMISDAGRFL